MAIILFSAADVSPPFLNLDRSATFSTLGSADADRPEKHTEKGMCFQKQRDGSKGVWAVGHQFTSMACFCCKFSLDSFQVP